jgi:Tfp pilus assembly protein PilX
VRNEDGVALIVVLLATMLLTGLALSLVLITSGETMLTANYRHSQEVLYGADAAIERVVQDVLTVSQWNQLIDPGGNLQSSFTEGPTVVTLADGTTIDVEKERARLQAESDATAVWGANNPVWQLYAYGPLSSILPDGVDSPVYVAVFVADDPSETDGNPSNDGNGVLTLHAEAWGAGGSRKVVEVTLARTSTTEIERGYIAQRGQEEWNQRARKAAVQTPGGALTEMKMGVGSSSTGLQVQ